MNYEIEPLPNNEWKHILYGQEFIMPINYPVNERKKDRCYICKTYVGSGCSWCKTCKSKFDKNRFKIYNSSSRKLNRKINTGFWNTKENPIVAAKGAATLKAKIAKDPSLHDKIYNHGKKVKSKEQWLKFFEENGFTKYSYEKLPEGKIYHQQKVEIICPIHGSFFQNISNHKNGHGCKKCQSENSKLDLDEFVSRSKENFGDLYDYSKTKYERVDERVEIICPVHGSFFQLPYSHMQGHHCQKCSLNGPSQAEEEIYQFVLSLGVNAIQSDRDILGGKELDIFVPEKSFAIEYCGIFWHSEKFKDNNYHKDKWQLCNDKNIHLLTIFEDEWLNGKGKVKSVIEKFLKGKPKGLAARKLDVVEIETKSAREFLNKYHLQGHVNSSVYMALLENGVPVSVMSFGQPSRKTKGINWELKRFAVDNKNRPGCASKLFKAFVKKYNPEKIVSLSDRRYFNGGVYKKLNFEWDGIVKPSYTYVKGIERFHSSKFTRKGIKKHLPNFYSDELTEKEMMINASYLRIWDCGKDRWIWNA